MIIYIFFIFFICLFSLVDEKLGRDDESRTTESTHTSTPRTHLARPPLHRTLPALSPIQTSQDIQRSLRASIQRGVELVSVSPNTSPSQSNMRELAAAAANRRAEEVRMREANMIDNEIIDESAGGDGLGIGVSIPKGVVTRSKSVLSKSPTT